MSRTEQQLGGSVTVSTAATRREGVWLSAFQMGTAAQATRYGSTIDAVRAGDLVIERYLESLRKLAEPDG